MHRAVPGEAADPETASSVLSKWRLRRLRMRRSDAAFRSEIRVFLQRRLALATSMIGAVGLALLVVSRLADLFNYGWVWENQLHPSVITHLGACVLAFLIYRALRRDALSFRALVLADAAITLTLTAVCLLVYAFSYETGIRQIVPLLGLALVVRAIVIPSSPMRTLVLSAPAPLGVLGIQLAHGQVFTIDHLPFPQSGYVSYLLWDQATLWLAAFTAALTSQVVYGLRVKAFEAAQIGRYTIEERIGGGAIGQVYRARHAHIRRPVAMKILRPEFASGKSLERFEREVQRTSLLTHPNTVQVYDYGLTPEGLFFYAMELLDGADLEQVVAVGGPMPPHRVLHVLLHACEALAEAHALDLVHCDLKPANLMLCRHGGKRDVVKVLDFGLARNIRGKAPDIERGTLTGTPLTMAPEVIRGKTLGPQADLYSLAAVGHFMLTGRPLFDGTTIGEVLTQHLRAEPTRASAAGVDVPAELEACLMRCLDKDPEARFEDAGELARVLRERVDVPVWTQVDAERWWREHEDGLRDLDSGDDDGSGATSAGWSGQSTSAPSNTARS